MTGRALISRFAFLTLFLLCASALHAMLYLNVSNIAKPFVPEYVPLDKQQAIEQAVKNCGQSVQFLYQQVPCPVVPSEGDILKVMSWHRDYYDNVGSREVESQVHNVIEVVFPLAYAALVLGAFWALIRWFRSNIWPKLAKSAGPLRTSLLRTSLNVSERGAARRLRRAEEEFRTLKSLRDEGLITEDVFVARKNKLKAAIKS